MQQFISTMDRSKVFIYGRGFVDLLAAALLRHRLLYLLGFLTLALGVAVGSITGNLPDFHVLEEYVFYILVAFWIGGSCFAIFHLIWLAAVERSKAPLSAFLKSFAGFFGDRSRIANTIVAFIPMIAFISGFSVLKGSIAILFPFSWDEALARTDVFLHFGRAPHEWLWWLTTSPDAIYVVNLAYNFWFVALIATIFTAIIAKRDSALRHQFLLSFMLIFLLGGVFAAMGFSSAGPCFYERLGYGDMYRPLFDTLYRANQVHPIWALSTQDMLWDGYTGKSEGSIGISAFPSMHVASSVLFALYASRRSAVLGGLLWCFAAVILFGSVALGWHYAVDGYAGLLITVAVWKSVGYVIARSPEGRFAQA